MPWTKAARIQYQRSGLRYASDLTDAEWPLIARLMPPRRRLGRPREVNLREIVQAIFYILSTGCQWRALPKEFPPYSTVQGYFYAWRDTGDGSRSSRPWFARRGEGSDASPNRQPPSSTVRPHRLRRPAGHAASTPASASMDASAISSPTPTVSCWRPMFTPPTFRMSMALCRCWRACEAASLSFNMSSPIAFIAANNSSTHSRTAGRGQSRSSSDRPGSKASSSCPGAGSSSAPLPGSADAGASPRTSKASAATELAWLLAAHLRLLTRPLGSLEDVDAF